VELSGILSSQEVPIEQSRFTDSQIVLMLAEADTGRTVKDVCREHGISPSTLPVEVEVQRS
jgi:hypothetical protein